MDSYRLREYLQENLEKRSRNRKKTHITKNEGMLRKKGEGRETERIERPETNFYVHSLVSRLPDTDTPSDRICSVFLRVLCGV